MTYKSAKIINLIAKKVSQYGGNTYYVGGCVRDKIMGKPIVDIDVEIHGVNAERLRGILNEITPFSEVGRSFGIFTLHEYNIDIALPRKERNTGNKHRDFDVSVDPFLGTYAAALRRDFTMNAIMEDVLSGEIIDHFNGEDDIKNGVIRHVNNITFSEDPLRVLRGAQFASRFGFEIHSDTIEISKNIDLSPLSAERVFDETRKALTKSPKPSLYFLWLDRMNQHKPWFNEAVLSSQNIDSAAKVREECEKPLHFMLAATVMNFPNISDVTNFLLRLTKENAVIRYVKNMYTYLPVAMEYNMTKPDKYSTNLLFDKVIFHDDFLRIVQLKCLDISFLRSRLENYRKTISTNKVTGKDLIRHGFSPTTEFSHLLNEAHKMQLSGMKKEDIIIKLISSHEIG